MMKRVFKIIMAIVWILLIGFTVSSAEEATPDNKSTEERIAVKISVLTTPTRTEYTAFDRFDADGLSVQVEYSTGECEVLERDLLTVEYLTDAGREVCWVENGYGYGLGIRTPDASGKRTDFGWNGAAGAFGAVDLKNEISLYYSQAVLASPARPLQSSYIEAAKLDLGFEARKSCDHNPMRTVG